MVERPLGPAQKNVLRIMMERALDPQTSAEIAEVVAVRTRRRLRLTTDAENVGNVLRSLEKRLLVKRAGVAYTGARCWLLTSLGQEVAAQVEDEV